MVSTGYGCSRRKILINSCRCRRPHHAHARRLFVFFAGPEGNCALAGLVCALVQRALELRGATHLSTVRAVTDD